MSRKTFLYQKRILVEFPFDMTIIREIKGFIGAEFRSKLSHTNSDGSVVTKHNVWIVECNESNIKRLEKLGFEISDGVRKGTEKRILKFTPIGDIEGLNVKLYQFQKEAIQHIEAWDGMCLLALQAGLGKTATSLAYYKKNNDIFKNVLIIAPAIMKTGWERETKLMIDKDVQILSGKTTYPITHDIVVVNYDVLWDWKKTLSSHKFDLVIIDEIHYLANPKAKRTKATKIICEGVKSVVGLTGTPCTSKIKQLYHPLQIINKGIFTNERMFQSRYCGGFQSRFGYNCEGATNLKELHEVLKAEVMYRKTKNEVLKDLPKCKHIKLLIDVDLTEYNKISDDFARWLEENGKTTPATALTKISPLRMEVLKKKIEPASDWIDNHLESGNKLVVFGIHKKGLIELQEKYKDISVLVNGDVQNKQPLVDKFVNDENIKIFFGNIDACATGLNGLQIVCQDMLFLENPWTYGKVDQAVSRLERIGQSQNISVYYMTAVNTIDEHIADLIQKQKNNIEQVIEGKDDTSIRENSVLKKLLETFKK